MEVFLLRHGIAEERRPGRADAKRALTGKGRERLGLVLGLARAAGVSPSLILTSPYVRAVQTAEMSAQILGCKRAIVHIDALLPGSTPEKVWEEIRSRREEAAVLLAGHEPLLGQAASFLLGASGGLMEMKKGALIAIGVDRFDARPRGLLRWLLPPRLAAAAIEELKDWRKRPESHK